MILFVGCSFTWGSGLQYEYLEKKGWSIEKLKKDRDRIITNNSIDPLDYKADEYRKQHSWPNLVAKKLNKPYKIGTTKSASNLNQILNSIKHEKKLCHSSKANQIDTIVVQFTDWTRDDLIVENSIDKNIECHIKQIADACDEIRNDKLISNYSYTTSYPSWVGLSWQKDIGQVLEKDYPENFIPLYYKKERYNNFESFRESGGLILNIDGHFNSKGCKIIADSIVKKLKQYETKTNKK
tara:strand:- start:3 stop:719 length:717 start_codon:yes stop_codon:yes gene_type:complete